MSSDANDRQAIASEPEDIFVELFAQVFGFEKVQMLVHDFAVEDIYGTGRFIDYALRTPDARIAFEIDGLTWHLPSVIPLEKYEDDLLRQNSLVQQGWRVFRWTDREIRDEPEQVKEQLALFLESIPGLLSFDEFLPKQQGEVFELRPHQEEALDSLDAMRFQGKTIGLLTHAQGAGKTIVAICDSKRLGGRTLFLAHRRELVTQAYDTFKERWPEVSTGIYMGDIHDCDAHNIAASIQSVSEHLSDFPTSAFQYLVVDEAHHAAAPIYKRVLGYFRPQFVLGLTATPDRADGQSILDVFRECAHRLTLREAVERGELVPIRCVRVLTNVDLSRVRFNQVQYNRKDIEEAILIPPRDRLIVETYQNHVPGRKAVAFCVNVRHGDSLAELFRRSGVPARSVSGRMSRSERQKYLEAFQRGQLRVLCACDILNEGWDCPDVEVLLMARPTLSKVVYLQQLGRGTRKARGKECLTVFDFVDNATRYNRSLNLNRVLGEKKYRPGGLLLAPEALRKTEEQTIAGGERPTTVIEIGLWAKEYQEIDLFSWQEAIAGMISAAELEVRLAASEGIVRRAIERGLLRPDHTLPLGERIYHYFDVDRAEEVREMLGLPKVEDRNIKDLFFEYVAEMDMSASYKPVMLLAVLAVADDRGRARLADVASDFRRFYEQRKAAGRAVERPSSRMANIDDVDDALAQRVMLDMPFEKFERRQYLAYDRDLAYIRFDPRLWRQLKSDDLAKLRAICEDSVAKYYDRLGQA
ncbi:MAG TPA: DEAD/DEAH box helicase family protein [Pirellulales bacterium]|nr:DEAD/DEAH box helicase family protein [Pirellulales bacterium]